VVGDVITSQDDRSEAIQMARVYKRVLSCFTVSFITVFPIVFIAIPLLAQTKEPSSYHPIFSNIHENIAVASLSICFSIKSNKPGRYAFCPDVWHPVTKCKQNAHKKAQADYCQKFSNFF